MKKLFPLFALLGLALQATVSAAPVPTPEPADYALGFGAATLGFIVWRNLRRAKAQR